ncbi:MAG: tripartite tricarboxylate transporter substrate binding protein [Planctomycetaceae bacterium]|nr:tripartite tricarboxylate transporter substrate binding protein [Planctomycetaceae bacterium]MBT6486865.1 tripartite tricarboxylate transporter substrate binding protein [Planctomycetaceae bacterium]
MLPKDDGILRLTLAILLNAVLLPLGLLLTLSDSGAGTAYPNRPIKLVVPFGAGGGTDTFARIMKQAIADEGLLKQPLAIINVGGAGATIGSRRVKNARPDGYTMLVLHDAIFTAQLSGTVEYGPQAFEPIAGTGEVGLVIAVREDSPYKTLEELMRAAREKPNEINFGANLGALTHYAGLQLQDGWPGAEFQFSQVGGGADRYGDLQGGHIDVTGFSIEEFSRFRYGEFGDLRGLAFLGKEPHPGAPDVPAARTAAGKPIIGKNVFYWWFPKGTPPERVALLSDVFEKAMQTEYVQRKMAEIQCEPIFLRGEALRRHLEESSARYADITPPPPVKLPNFVAVIITAVALLGGLVLLQDWRVRMQNTGAASMSLQSKKTTPRNGLAGICLGLTFLYVLAMSAAAIDFRIATIVYVLAVGATLMRFKPRGLPWVLAVAQSMAFGLHFVMTRLFEIDLP